MTTQDLVTEVRRKLADDFAAGRLDAENELIRADFASIEPSELDRDSQLYRSLLEPTEGNCVECDAVTDEHDPEDSDAWLCADCLQAEIAQADEDARLDYLGRVLDLR